MDVEDCLKEWEDLIADYKHLEVQQFYVKRFRNFLYFSFHLCNIMSYTNTDQAVYILVTWYYHIYQNLFDMEFFFQEFIINKYFPILQVKCSVCGGEGFVVIRSTPPQKSHQFTRRQLFYSWLALWTTNHAHTKDISMTIYLFSQTKSQDFARKVPFGQMVVISLSWGNYKKGLPFKFCFCYCFCHYFFSTTLILNVNKSQEKNLVTKIKICICYVLLCVFIVGSAIVIFLSFIATSTCIPLQLIC